MKAAPAEPRTLFHLGEPLTCAICADIVNFMNFIGEPDHCRRVFP